MSTSLSPSSSLDMLSPTSPSTRWASDSLSDEDEIVWSLSSSAMLSPPLNMSPLSEAADYVLVPRIDASATTTPPTPPPPPSTTSTTAAGVAADQVRELEAPTSDDAIAVVAEEMAALSLGTTAADMLTAPVSDSVSVSPSVSVSVSASASGATPTKKKCRKNRRRAGTTAQGLGVAMPSASEPTKKRKKAKKVVAPPSSCPSSSAWSSTSSSSSYHSSSGGGQSRSESASASEFESASASASAAARAAPPPLSLPSVATKKSSDGFSLSSSSSSSCASFSSAAVATPQPQKLREKQPKKKKNKGVSGSPAHAQGHAPVAAAADVANVKEEEPISTGYHEAHKFMTTYVLITSLRLIPTKKHVLTKLVIIIVIHRRSSSSSSPFLFLFSPTCPLFMFCMRSPPLFFFIPRTASRTGISHTHHHQAITAQRY